MTDPIDSDDTCPGCGAHGVQPQPAPPTVAAWRCSACGLSWAISLVNPHVRRAYPADLVAAAAEINRLRWTLVQVIALADQAPTLTDRELRTTVGGAGLGRPVTIRPRRAQG